MYPKYFLQERKWADFWLESSKSGHSLESFKTEDGEEILIYIYPWTMGFKLAYIPRFYSRANNLNILNKRLKSVLKDLKRDPKIVFLKLDFDDRLISNLATSQSHLESNFLFHFSFQKSYKSIQFLQTMTLDLVSINNPQSEVLSLQELQDFYQQNTEFWSQTNQTVRRYTKKSLVQPWTISTAKTKNDFEDFYKIYNQTKDRQNFAIQPKEYLQKLFDKDWCHTIILRSTETNQPECVWMGIVSEDTLTYLYGGNSDYSFSHQGQYLAHLVATSLAAQADLKYYDLGGYNPTLGFGKFKEGYKGSIREFYGAYDFKIKPAIYNLITPLLALRSWLKGNH